MIAVFWKEMRENWRWASLGFLAMAATLILMWRASPLVFGGDVYGQTSSVLWVGIIAAFTASGLGILQTRRDKRPASCALLLHRGITADAAFAGKLLAGLALYSLALFIPLLAMALFIAINGIEHKAASVMSLTPMALLAGGAFGFWPAALLIVHRDAKLFGSRLMPAVSAIMATFICLTVSGAVDISLVFLLIALLSLFVLFLAARSVFANSSQIATGIGRAALAMTVSIALLVLSTFVVSMVETYRMTTGRTDAGPPAVHTVQLGPEGEPWLGRQDYSQQDASYELTRAAKLAVGRSVRDELEPIGEDWKKTPSWLINRYYVHVVRGDWARFTRIANASAPTSAGFLQRQWVFDHRDDAILVYHLTLSGQWQLVRSLRPSESVGSFGEVRRIGQSDGDGNFTLVTSTGAFYAPGDGSAVVTMYQAPASSTILDFVERTQAWGHTHHAAHSREEDEPMAMMLRLEDRVVLLESDLDETTASRATPIGEVGSIGRLYATEIQLPDELTEPKSLCIARDPNHDGAYLGLAQNGPQEECHIVWARVDANGRIAAQQEYIENTGAVRAFDGLFFSASVPPAVWAIVFSGFLVTSHDPRLDDAWDKAWEEAREHPLKTTGALLLYLLPGIVGVPLAMWAARRRRLNKRQTRLCLAWGFLMGPAGSLSILAVYPRIVRERCISCQRPTRIDLQQCEHCGHRLDDMPRIGIEIFGRDTLAASKQPETIGSC